MTASHFLNVEKSLCQADVVIQPHKKREFVSKTNLEVHILMMKKNPSVAQWSSFWQNYYELLFSYVWFFIQF